MYTIYGYSTFNGVKVVLTAEELGIDYDYVHVDLGKGQNRSDEYKQKHPYKKIPALEHNGHSFIESHSICRYLANVNNQRLYSADPVKAAHIDQTIDVLGQHIGRWLAVHFWEEVIKPGMLKQTTDAAKIAEADGFLKNQLPYIDQLLEANDYLCGNEVTIADTIAFAYFELQEITSVNLDEYENITRWYRAFAKRPAVERTKKKLGLIK